MSRIGIDVGGTNTDAVVLNGTQLLAKVKTATTADITSGILDALESVLAVPSVRVDEIDAVMIGTTHFINAVVQGNHLNKAAVIRIGLPASASLPPFTDWPPELAALVNGGVYMIAGGHEYDGREITPLDEAAISHAAQQIAADGIQSVAICAIFSPLKAACEERAAAIISQIMPDVHVSCSHTLGRIGLLERENATILNAGLIELAQITIRSFETAVQASGIQAPLYITQNDGTVMSAADAIRRPIFSFASGATNSMRGAAVLSGLQDGLVVDVGGTTTDIGSIKHGYPREANAAVRIGGVRTLFRMPDLNSIGLGGGSHVSFDDNKVSVGPYSVGYRLTAEAQIFGGQQLTASDVAAVSGMLDLGDHNQVGPLSADQLTAVFDQIKTLLADSVDQMKLESGLLPLVAVGGGAFLVPGELPGISEVVYVEHGGVANAVGAAIAQISGEVDQIFQAMSREEALAAAAELATQRAVAAGADAATITVVDVDDSPLAYLPGNARRVRTRVVGDLVD